MTTQAVFLYCCPDCLLCPASALQIGKTTWVMWAAVKNTASVAVADGFDTPVIDSNMV